LSKHSSLKDVHENQRFAVRHGPSLHNLEDLEHELSRMSEHQFKHHVSNRSNDFYNWVYHAVKDRKLAKSIAKIKSQEEMAVVVKRHINDLKIEKTVKTKVEIKQPKVEKAKKPKTVKPKVSKPKAVKIIKKKIPKTKIKTNIKTVEKPKPIELPGIKPLPVTFEEVQRIIEEKISKQPITLGHDDFKPEPPESISHSIIKDDMEDAKKDIKRHMVPYILGIMGGVLAGLVLARFFI